MALQDEIDAKAKEIYTDGYPMSIGELISIYNEKELDIHPEFQRIYRWSEEQKSKFIESIMLSIPIPSIFVSQRSDGIWDVIDGVQRLSTIFEFLGILEDEEKKIVKPLKLVGTEFLPSLQDKTWKESEDSKDPFTEDQRRFFKRAKIDIKIIKKESDDSAKYELFQRLNTGGSRLSDQEVRNCLMIMINPDFYRWLNDIKNSNEWFKQCTAILPDKAKNEQYDLELLSRFLIYRHSNLTIYKTTKDLEEMITDEIKNMCSKPPFDLQVEEEVIADTFGLLSDELGEDTFRKFNSDKNKFEGAFSVSLFEAIVPGLSKNLSLVKKWPSGRLVETIKSIYSNTDFTTYASARGVRPITRIRNLIELSERLFGDDNKNT